MIWTSSCENANIWIKQTYNDQWVEDAMKACQTCSVISLHTSGIGALRPGTFKFGYDGGGPYLCMAINHGGGNFSEFWN